jgi:hypothetical protein
MARSKTFLRLIRFLRGGRRPKGSFLKTLGKVGMGAALIKGGLGYIEKMIDDKLAEAALDGMQTPLSLSPIIKPKENNVEKPLTLASIVSDVNVEPKEIIPELGPHEGQYAIHLNLIIERIAKLESSVLTQANLIAKLESVIGKYNEEERKERFKKQQKDREDSIEQRTFLRNLGRSTLNFADTGVKKLSSIMKPFLLPIAALALASSINLKESEDDEKLISDDMFEKISNAVDFVENWGDKIALGLFTSGSRLGKDFLKTGSAIKGATAAAAGNVKSGLIDSTLRMRQASPIVNSIFEFKTKTTDFVKTKFDFTGIASKFKLNNSPKLQKIIKSLTRAGSFFEGIAKKSADIMNDVKNFLQKLPSSIGKFISKLGKSIVKWVLVIEAIKFMWRAANLYLLGEISEEEFHKGNKEQINIIIATLGAPWILTIIGSAVPVVGTAFGFIVGLIWGEDIYNYIGMNRIVDAFYDWIVLDKPLSQIASEIWGRVKDHFTFTNIMKRVFGFEFELNVPSETAFNYTDTSSESINQQEQLHKTPDSIFNSLENQVDIPDSTQFARIITTEQRYYDNKITKAVALSTIESLSRNIQSEEYKNKVKEIKEAINTGTGVSKDKSIDEVIKRGVVEPEVPIPTETKSSFNDNTVAQNSSESENKEEKKVNVFSSFADDFSASLKNIINADDYEGKSSVQDLIKMNMAISGSIENEEDEETSEETQQIRDIIKGSISVLNKQPNEITIVPIPMQNQITQQRNIPNAGSGIASLPESATSTYGTTDRFLTPSMIT